MIKNGVFCEISMVSFLQKWIGSSKMSGLKVTYNGNKDRVNNHINLSVHNLS